MTTLPWAAELPPSWKIVPARAMLKPVRRDPRSTDATVTAFRDGQVTLRSNRRSDGFTESVKEIGYQGVRQGEVVIHSMDAFAGAIGVSDSDGKMSPVVHIYTTPNDNPEFIVHALRVASQAGFIRALAKGIRERSTSFDRPVLKSMLLPRPPREDQDLIVEYLDRETQKIDELITEQRGLIESLRERRQSVITSAVTGENENEQTFTRSSWYPSIPKGWTLGRVKYYASRVTDGAHIAPDTDGGVHDFVSTRDVKEGGIDFSGSLKTTKETYEYMVKTGCRPMSGDVLFSKDGTVGETAVVRADRDFVVASSLVIVSPERERLNADYLAYVFASKTGREQAMSMMRGAGLPRLSVANLARLELPLPSRDEQQRIAGYLDEQTSRIDELISESEDLIALSQERRAALITAAVTGQIDVRTTA